eukprot:403371431
MQDLKKCMLEMSLVGMIRDDLKRSDGMQFEVKIGDELVAKWFEPKSMSSQHGLIKKIRFPFKFRFLNSKISIEVNPIPDERSLNQMTEQELMVQDYTIYHTIFDFNQVLKNLQVLTPAYQVPDIEEQQNILSNTSQSQRIQAQQEVMEIKQILLGKQDQGQTDMQVVDRKMEIVDEVNPYITIPRKHVNFYSQEMQAIAKGMLLGPMISESYSSLIDTLNQGQLQVVPIIAVDFSLANLTFLDDQCLHSTKSDKPNDYKDILKMICESYSNILNIPIFGYSAKTTKNADKAASFFPITQDLRNPFVTNDPELIDESYTKCLKSLELATPINLLPVFSLVKKLGQNVRKIIDENNGRIDCFYVLYILSPGLIDDLPDLLETLDCSWDGLPIQIHLINLSTTNIMSEDLDTIKFQDFTMKYNLQQSCWMQFNVHFYDRIKSKYGHRPDQALSQLKETAIESVPKEIETYLFLNQLKANKFAFKGEAVQQSLLNLINLLEEKNQLLFQQAKELGIDKQLVEKMMHQQKFFEWNIEVLQGLLSNQNSSENDNERQNRKQII